MSKVEELKTINKCKTSEDLLGIENPPDYVCSKIDSLIGTINSIENLANEFDDDADTLRDKLKDINFYIRNVENDLENMRSNIEDIRAWGQEWKDTAKCMIEKFDVDIEEIV